MMQAALFCSFCIYIYHLYQSGYKNPTQRDNNQCVVELLTCKVKIKHFQVEHSLIYAKDLIWGLVLLKGDQCGF